MKRNGWMGFLGLAVAALAGCVTAFDPSAPPRYTLETRSEETGTKIERPRTRGMRPVAKVERSESPAPQQVQPASPVLATVATPIEPPETPAGVQLSWWLAVLGGGDTRKLETHFSPQFLEKVPASQVRVIARQWRRDEIGDGDLEIVKLDESSPQSLTAIVRGKVTDRYTQIRLGVDEEGRIQTLWLGPLAGYKPGALDTWAKIDDRMRELPGKVSFAVYELQGGGGDARSPVHLFEADRRLAIGSTFKLYVLGALAEEILAGRIRWDEPLAINDTLKSLPGGRMQLETEGTEHPISRYAELMISVSDNTATDHLLHRLGRERAEAYMAQLHDDPAVNRPFLTTMEMFRLKLATDRTLIERYAAVDEDQRRAMLAPGGEVPRSVPNFIAVSLWKAPQLIDRVEWFATADECCRVMADLHRLEEQAGLEPLGHILRINPGLQFDRSAWPGVAYKGGSEPGVLNMTWLLERADGRRFLLSFGWNDTMKDVDLRQAADVVGAAVALLAKTQP